MSGSQQLLLGGSVQQAVDPFFYSVTSLLHGDGTNGGQNNTFLDSSSNNFTITRNGNTTQGSFSPFSQTGWSNYFDGSGDYLTFPNNSSIPFGTGSFTIEFWINGPLNNDKFILGGRSAIGGSFHITTGGAGGTTAGALRYVGSSTITSGSVLITNDTWTHCAIVRNGSSDVTLYVNGIAVGTGTDTTNYTTTTGTWVIGANDFQFPNNVGSNQLNAYLSNLRIVKSAVYTANFTPPTAPLTAITNTQFLSCQSNRFIDNSTNASAITVNGNPSVQPFSPFNPTTAYSTSAVGGSGYFDGSGDYLTTANNSAFNPGTGDFTIECWINTSVTKAYHTIASVYGSPGVYNGWYFYLDATGTKAQMSLFDGSSIQADYIGTSNVNNGAWCHIAFVRTGTTVGLFVNGTREATGTNNFNITSTADLRVSGFPATSRDWNGYISGFRIIKGSGPYNAASSTLTVPTAPFTAITNTSYLLNFTNGAIFDNAADADYETVGNAQISTSVKKYGTGSLAFDGTGDYLKTPVTDLLDFKTGDFTIECWAYFNNTSDSGGLGAALITKSGGGTTIYSSTNGGTTLTFYNGSGIVSGTIALSTWLHIAVSRASGTVKFFVNGTQTGSATHTSAVSFSGAFVGSQSASGGYLNGYIDDLRVSKGVARYLYNFTPPTAALPDIGGTITLTADPYYEYTTLLLPGNGTNGAQNNTFLDSSTNAYTITRNGNTTQGTFSPFSQTGWGNYFDGNGDYLSVASNAALSWGTGDYTVECWVYLTAATSRIMVVTGTGNFVFFTNGSNQVVVGRVGTDELVSTITVTLNTWNHIAATRASNTTRIFINGVSAVTPASITTNYGQNTVSIGSDGVNHTTGYISNFRAIKGTALYTADFTPPTTPLTAITNTSLLTCQSNRFIDNSTNNFTITRNGDVSVQAFSPFNPTAAWSAATNGGSGYFDGSGDYLTAPSDAAFALSGDFSMECWAYFAGATAVGGGPSGELLYAADATGGAVICVRSGTLIALSAKSVADDLSASVTFTPGQWYHLVAARTGTTAVLYVSGTRVATGTVSRSYAQGGFSTQSGFNGYLTSVRIVKGSNPYGTGTTITVPTAPLTAIANTSLLLNYTNAGIYDATSKNDLETVGNAQISTTQSKFGGSSIYLDGTGDWLSMPNNQNFVFGTGDFTIEFWYYGNDTAGGFGQLSGGTTGYWQLLLFSSSMYWQSVRDTTNLFNVSASSILNNAWHHVAVTRYAGTTRLFFDGVQVASAADTTNYNGAAGNFILGRDTNSADLAGYINDYRITKGIARYTSNFIPPSTAFLTL